MAEDAADLVSLIMTPTGPLEDTVTQIVNTAAGCRWELLVVQNEPVAALPPLARLLTPPNPLSLRELRRWGVRESRGGLLLFLDAPHRFSPGWLANLILAMQRRNGRALVAPLIVDLDSGDLSYGWTGWERSFCARHLHRREVGRDGRVPATGGQVMLVTRAVYAELGDFCPHLFGAHSDLVEFCHRAARQGVETFVEISSVVWQRFAKSYPEPVSWAQVSANNLLLAYLDGQEPAARRCCRWKPDYEEARALFEGLRPQIEPYPGARRLAHPGSALVSVVIAAHNEGNSVRRTVDSLRAQQVELELVLVDDGSQDGSFDFLEQADYRQDGRIRRFRFEQSVGCIQARHQGVLLAAGSTLLFLDAHMALPATAVEELRSSLARAGPLAAVVPDVAVLNPDDWSIGPSTGQVFSINERLAFVWEQPRLPGGLVPVGGGCCVMLARALYHQVGGFDLALRRWGSEFTDLCLKIYALGGCCYWESEVRVGHLFRSTFPYAIEHADILYNRLRTAFIHFSPEVFERFRQLVADEPGAEKALALLEEHRSALETRRLVQLDQAARHPDWFVFTFLPGLKE